MICFVRSRYTKWNTDFETVYITLNEDEAKAFIEEEKARLGEDYDFIIVKGK